MASDCSLEPDFQPPRDLDQDASSSTALVRATAACSGGQDFGEHPTGPLEISPYNYDRLTTASDHGKVPRHQWHSGYRTAYSFLPSQRDIQSSTGPTSFPDDASLDFVHNHSKPIPNIIVSPYSFNMSPFPALNSAVNSDSRSVPGVAPTHTPKRRKWQPILRDFDTDSKYAPLSKPRDARNSGELDTSPRYDEEMLEEIASYVTRARNTPCSTTHSRKAPGGRYKCTWFCGYSTESRDAWIRHEERKQPQHFWHCVVCRSPQRHGGKRTAFISHRKDKFLSHARASHPGESSAVLRDLSAVAYQAPYIQTCRYALSNQRVCDSHFSSWVERNDHYIKHFDGWQDCMTSKPAQQVQDHASNEDQDERLNALRAMSAQPRRQPELLEATISRLHSTYISHHSMFLAHTYYPLATNGISATPLPYMMLRDATTSRPGGSQARAAIMDGQQSSTGRKLEDLIDLLIIGLPNLGVFANDSGLKTGDRIGAQLQKLKDYLTKMFQPLTYCALLMRSRGSLIPEIDMMQDIAQHLVESDIHRDPVVTMSKQEESGIDTMVCSSALTVLERTDAVKVSTEPWTARDTEPFGKSDAPLIQDSDELRWLRVVAKQVANTTYDPTMPRHNALRHCFMTSLSQMLQYDYGIVHRLCARLDWSPVCLVRDDQEKTSSKPALTSVITLVGHGLTAYASTCADYVNRVWPNFGQIVLQSMQDAADSDTGICNTTYNNVQIAVRCTTTRSLVDATGPAVALLEIFECVAWLGAACRPSPESSEISECEVVVENDFGGFLSFDVTYKFSAIALRSDRVANEDCWRDMFRNPVIVTGFPVPLREAGERGLEMSVPLLAVLGQSFWATNVNGFLLKGFNSIMAPIKRIGNSILWHFQVNKDGTRMPYKDGNQNNAFSCYADAIPVGARHFVGWTEVQSLVGTQSAAGSAIEESESRLTEPGVCMDSKLSLQAGQYLFVGVNIRRGTKDQPEYLSWDLYERQIDTVTRWGVTLCDTHRGRHYLVDGASAILHLCLAWLLSGHIRYAPKNVIAKLKIPTSSSPDAAYNALIDLENRKAELLWSEKNKSWWRFENLAQEFFHILEQIHDRVGCRNKSEIELSFASGELIGFDAMDLLLEHGLIRPRTRKLQPNAASWLALCGKLNTINILGSNFGELIKPVPQNQTASGGCGLRDAFPPGLDYLAVTLPTLKNITGRHREHTENSLHLVENLYLSNPWSYFAQCLCQQSMLSQCTNLVKRLNSSKSSDGAVSRTHGIYAAYPNGALIFGSHREGFSQRAKRKRQEEECSISAGPSQDSRSQDSPSETHSSDSGVDVDSTGISSASDLSPSQRAVSGQASPPHQWSFKGAAKRCRQRVRSGASSSRS